MIDASTLGSISTSAISSICLIRFNPYTGKVFENLILNMDISLGLHLGAEVSSDSILWWMDQSDSARKNFINSQMDSMDPIDATILIKDWINSIEEEIDEELIMWSNGAGFDIPILANYFNLLGVETPWSPNNVRDVRTVVNLAPEIKKSTSFEGTKTIPLFECMHQIKYVSETLNFIIKPHINK